MTASTAWHVINGLVFVAWVVCIVSWMRRGCPIPKWLHVFAGTLLAAGIAVVVILGATDMLSLELAVSCIVVPPAAAYIGWLWMFGPSIGKKQIKEQGAGGDAPGRAPKP